MAYCEIKSINAPEKTYGDHLVVKNISVVDSWSYPDCSYKERIRFLFTHATNAVIYAPLMTTTSLKITLDIETGYIPYEIVGRSLKETLSGAFRIVKLDELIKAFKYRGYYCKI